MYFLLNPRNSQLLRVKGKLGKADKIVKDMQFCFLMFLEVCMHALFGLSVSKRPSVCVASLQPECNAAICDVNIP